MGRVFLIQIEGKSYRCRFCSCPLAVADDILSRQTFSCGHGTAYLFNNAVNVTVGPEEERAMLSGTHSVADIYCCNCGQILGWKYIKVQDISHEKSQKYKEGKFVLERWRICEADGSSNNNNLDLEAYPNNISSDDDAH